MRNLVLYHTYFHISTYVCLDISKICDLDLLYITPSVLLKQVILDWCSLSLTHHYKLSLLPCHSQPDPKGFFFLISSYAWKILFSDDDRQRV